MRRFLAPVVVLLLAGLLGGCPWVLPETSALEKVHDTYRADFAHSVLPTGPRAGASSCSRPAEATDAAFAGTLRAIRDFRIAHPTAKTESAHLLVLEGMIYLQRGETGMARLLHDNNKSEMALDVAGSGSYARDALFARNFASLIDGWQWVCAHSGRPLNLDEPTASATRAADAILADLADLAQQNKLATPEADEGAAYLATTAGIFYAWAGETEILRCGRRGIAVTACAPAKDIYAKARDGLRPFLSKSEVEVAAAAPPNVAAGRLRYIGWYRVFSCKADGRGDCP